METTLPREEWLWEGGTQLYFSQVCDSPVTFIRNNNRKVGKQNKNIPYEN